MTFAVAPLAHLLDAELVEHVLVVVVAGGDEVGQLALARPLPWRPGPTQPRRQSARSRPTQPRSPGGGAMPSGSSTWSAPGRVWRPHHGQRSERVGHYRPGYSAERHRPAATDAGSDGADRRAQPSVRTDGTVRAAASGVTRREGPRGSPPPADLPIPHFPCVFLLLPPPPPLLEEPEDLRHVLPATDPRRSHPRSARDAARSGHRSVGRSSGFRVGIGRSADGSCSTPAFAGLRISGRESHKGAGPSTGRFMEELVHATVRLQEYSVHETGFGSAFPRIRKLFGCVEKVG